MFIYCHRSLHRFLERFLLIGEKISAYPPPRVQKDFFVFTDNEHIDFEENANVFKIYQKKLGWPYDTMMRFDMFLTQEEKLKEYDYIYFFNANMEFVAPVGEEFLPDEEHNGLAVCLSPGYYNKKPNDFPYDRNPKSVAYIPFGTGKYYIAGGLNGGTSRAYLNLCRDCSKLIQTDLENNVIPKFHDESILNKYVLNKNPLILDCRYLYPEGKNLRPFKKDIKILLHDKSAPKYGGHAWLRGETDTKITKPQKTTFTFLGIRFSFKRRNKAS